MFVGTALSVRLFVCAGLSLFIIYGPYLYVVVCVFYAYNLTQFELILFFCIIYRAGSAIELIAPKSCSYWPRADHNRTTKPFIIYWLNTIYVSLQLRVRNRRRKWHFPPNLRNDIIGTAPFPLNIHNGIIWGGAFSKAFRPSEALISILSKNAHLYDNI